MLEEYMPNNMATTPLPLPPLGHRKLVKETPETIFLFLEKAREEGTSASKVRSCQFRQAEQVGSLKGNVLWPLKYHMFHLSRAGRTDLSGRLKQVLN